MTSDFKTASERAEGWVHGVFMVAYHGENDQVDFAYKSLQILNDQYVEHVETLRAEFDRLRVLSDEPVSWPADRGYGAVYQDGTVSVWSSAHEAAVGIVHLALDLLFWPVVVDTEVRVDRDDPKAYPFKTTPVADPAEKRTRAEWYLANRWKAIAFSASEDAALQERIRRERAKLIARPPVSGEPSRPDEYVPFSELVDRTESQDDYRTFGSYAKAKKFLDDHHEIRRRKPSKYRLDVHELDWLRAVRKPVTEEEEEEEDGEGLRRSEADRKAQIRRK